MKVLAFSGSNHSQSINQNLVKYAAQELNKNVVEVIDLRDYPLPVFSIDLEKSDSFPDTLLQLIKKIKAYDAYIISSPEHNGGTPAFFKNTIDWLSRAEKGVFGNKPTLLMSTSPGAKGGSSNLAYLQRSLPYQGAKIVSTYSLGSFYTNMVEGKLIEEQQTILSEAIKTFEKELEN